MESNEYGYGSLVKAAKKVLNEIDLEDRTLTRITSKARKENRLWNPIALREAIFKCLCPCQLNKGGTAKI